MNEPTEADNARMVLQLLTNSDDRERLRERKDSVWQRVLGMPRAQGLIDRNPLDEMLQVHFVENVIALERSIDLDMDSEQDRKVSEVLNDFNRTEDVDAALTHLIVSRDFSVTERLNKYLTEKEAGHLMETIRECIWEITLLDLAEGDFKLVEEVNEFIKNKGIAKAMKLAANSQKRG